MYSNTNENYTLSNSGFLKKCMSAESVILNTSKNAVPKNQKIESFSIVMFQKPITNSIAIICVLYNAMERKIRKLSLQKMT